MLVHRELALLPALALRFHLLACRACRERSRRFASVSDRFRGEFGQPRVARRRLRPSLALVAAMVCILATFSLGVWAYNTLNWYSYEADPAATITRAELDEMKKKRGKDKTGPRSHAQKPSRASVD
jgi:hypothetical protein